MSLKSQNIFKKFLNIFIKRSYLASTVNASLKLDKRFGHSVIGNGQSIQIEFVSANPTGPLHVGHGRGAAFGDAVGKILQANGYDVSKEYYINDAGRQMDILAASVWLRFHNCFDEKLMILYIFIKFNENVMFEKTFAKWCEKL